MSPHIPRRVGLAVLLVVLAGVIGCGGGGAPGGKFPGDSAGAPPAAKDGATPAGGQPGGDAAALKVAPAERKIIYTATLDVVVKDLDEARAEAEKLLAGHKGYVAKSEVRTDVGARRTATYTLRVPAEHFEALRTGLAGLGTAERNAVDSQDVTEEYVDVQARLKNLKAEEEVLNKLLGESGSRDEVLKTREQIRTVRGDIERAQARLDLLSKLTTLSTVHLTLREIKDYVPPSAPTFRARAARTFEDSWEALVSFGEGVALFAVALTPWLPVLIPVGLVGFVVVRKLWRASTARPDRPPHRHPPRARVTTEPRPEVEVVVEEPPPGEPKPG